MTASRTEAQAWPAPPPQLLVTLEWTVASGSLHILRSAKGLKLIAHCTASATAYRAAVIVQGGPANDATVTAELLVELAAWLRALSTPAYTALAQAAASGAPITLGAEPHQDES